MQDLAKIGTRILKEKPFLHYIAGVDNSHSTMKEILEVISSNVGNKKTRELPLQEVAGLEVGGLEGEFEEEYFNSMKDMMIDLHLDLSSLVFEEGRSYIDWHSQGGIVPNINTIVNEFNTYRALKPIKIFISGPPAAGKTLFAER